VVAAVTSKTKVATSKHSMNVLLAQLHIKWFGCYTPLLIQSKLVGHLGAHQVDQFLEEN
jgi:hypothetical protein